MKRTLTTLALVGAATALAACGQKTETRTAEAPAPAASAPMAPAPAADSMAGMNMAAGGEHKMAKGTGTVTAVDATAGTVTIDHGPIPEANWPAMTMGFKAAPALAQGVKAGDKVAFDLKLENGAGEITAIQKQ